MLLANHVEYYDGYLPVGDISVIAIILALVILMTATYITKSRNYLLYKIMLGLVYVAAFGNLMFHFFSTKVGEVPDWYIYAARDTYYIALISNLFLYVIYLKNILWLDRATSIRFMAISAVGYIVSVVTVIISPALKIFCYIEDGKIISDTYVFMAAYAFFVVMLLWLLLGYRDRIVKQIMVGVLGTVSISLAILGIQGMSRQTSFTTLTFILPMIAILYLIHANPYDIETGAVPETAFEDMVEDSYEHGKPFRFMSLYMHDFDGVNRIPRDVNTVIRHFATSYFKGAVMFRVAGNHLVLVFTEKKNPDYNDNIQTILSKFAEVYPTFKHDYKIVIGYSDGALSKDNDYIALLLYTESKMKENEIYWISKDDIERFRDYKYILSQLEDINKKCDLTDPRVLVYCQPVFNLSTGRYDTAEALMRLKLEKMGMVYPDQFIPVAERHQMLHTLSKIILNKTCKIIKGLLAMGFDVHRISVNFSVSEMRDENFSQEILEIVNKNKIPAGKIAIEITESSTESDFLIMKKKINELKENGILFYLDDFGTGYSNFERIMELPFDIIKFDRSLVIASDKEKKSETMVSSLAHMFAEMNYSVLYEGVENDSDEERCRSMYASYLQGYKYSKPIPIEELTEYFTKAIVEPVVAATIADAASASTAAVAGIIEKNDLLENAVQ
ncbi:MAG: EAL domain-containing protein [Lachnospiraceae bacterium]|nr:EAL domain-containing protein [Lachnospiraceae bacterium]